jgi:2-polyprenyl-3-methyl-5-hydroxy-6-metoxy-1,4-benzoquinol methylase
MRIFFFLTLLMISLNSASFDYIGWWENWYNRGGTSGPGSRGIVAQYKADVINQFLSIHSINSVLEFGCGDGYNLGLIHYKEYVGLDVTKASIKMCTQIFKNDSSKSFMLYDPKYFTNKGGFKNFDLIVCLDVLFHVVNEDEFIKTLDDIFSFKTPYIIIYSTLTEKWNDTNPEIYNRNVLEYLKKYTDYTYEVVENKYNNVPWGSWADWVFLKRKS